jgi:hypothetical protein
MNEFKRRRFLTILFILLIGGLNVQTAAGQTKK